MRHCKNLQLAAVRVAEKEEVSLHIACLNLYCFTSRKTSNAAPVVALPHFNAIRIGPVKICVYWGAM